MTPAMVDEVRNVLDRVEHLEDLALFRRRQQLVADLGLDERDIVAKVLTLQVMRIAFVGPRFDLDIEGVEPEPAVIMGVLDADERLLDMVAWPFAAPRWLATLLGRVAMIGEHNLETVEPLGHRVAVHRDAIAWLRAGCTGVVPIDAHRSARRFLEVDGVLVAEDVEHARALAAARSRLVDEAPAILIPDTPRRAAA